MDSIVILMIVKRMSVKAKVKQKRLITDFLEAPYLEDVDPMVLYEVRSRLQHVGKLLIMWDIRQLKSRQALRKIGMVLREVRDEAWKKYLEQQKRDGRKT